MLDVGANQHDTARSSVGDFRHLYRSAELRAYSLVGRRCALVELDLVELLQVD